MRRCRGLTLIELLIAILLIGILIAVLTPSMTDAMARKRLEGIANELSTDLQYSKSQAVSTNTSVSLITSANGYLIQNATSVFKTITLDSKVSLTAPLTISFEPYRDFSSTATVTVTHTQTPAQLLVKVDPMGRIQLCSPNASLVGYPAC